MFSRRSFLKSGGVLVLPVPCLLVPKCLLHQPLQRLHQAKIRHYC